MSCEIVQELEEKVDRLEKAMQRIMNAAPSIRERGKETSYHLGRYDALVWASAILQDALDSPQQTD